MKFKGTQGNWHIKEGGFSQIEHESIQIYATNEDLELVCKVEEDLLLHNKKQDFKANAQLIATSPELLEAIQKAMIISNLWLNKGNKTSRNTLELMYAEFERVINKAIK